MGRQILSMRKIDKRFTGVHALKQVDFDLEEAEIHALVGENGAGKSTLMKVLVGINPKDTGEIHYLGHLFNPRSPKQALQMGIGIIHQELSMMYHLTVAQNIFIGRESVRFRGMLLDEREQNRRAEELFARLKMNIDPREQLGRLSFGKQQMVEIAKAVSHDLRILILDELTAALTDAEIEELFAIMRDLASRGVGMIHISHRLDEIHRIANRVTVLRDGERVGTKPISEVTRQQIISMMVGRVIYEQPKTNSAVFGADEVQSGTIEVRGRRIIVRSPEDAVANGIGYLSEDRKRFGLAVNLSVKDNLALASWDRFQAGLFVQAKKVRQVTDEYIRRLNIKTRRRPEGGDPQ